MRVRRGARSGRCGWSCRGGAVKQKRVKEKEKW